MLNKKEIVDEAVDEYMEKLHFDEASINTMAALNINPFRESMRQFNRLFVKFNDELNASFDSQSRQKIIKKYSLILDEAVINIQNKLKLAKKYIRSIK